MYVICNMEKYLLLYSVFILNTCVIIYFCKAIVSEPSYVSKLSSVVIEELNVFKCFQRDKLNLNK